MASAIDFWTDERVQYLRASRIAGLSATEIGMKIGATRSAVLGKAHRLQIDGGSRDVSSQKPRVRWRSGDVARLRKLAEDGLCVTQIAGAMDRSPAGIINIAARERVVVARYSDVERETRAVQQRERDCLKKQRQRGRRITPAKSFKPGTSKTSVIYRNNLPRAPEMTKGELRAFLAKACANTAEAAHG